MLPHYVDCQFNGADSELLLVEGKSAMAAVKQVRNRNFQAILAMQGKVPNALKHSPAKVMSNEHCAELTRRLACGHGANCDPAKLRYAKVCILSESDPDGVHARQLLCVLFQTHFKQLVDHERIRVVRAPLYRIQNSVDEELTPGSPEWHSRYLWSEEAGRRYLNGPDQVNTAANTAANVSANMSANLSIAKTGTLTQFKGLASLSGEELLMLVVKPATRNEETVSPAS